jgi:hypothetical protein
MPEIATITGHSLKDVEAILDAHYLGGTTRLGAPRSASWSAPPWRRKPIANKKLENNQTVPDAACRPA